MSKARPLIAIVDDESSVRLAIQRLIRSSGMDAETFPSGDEFLASMQAHLPDCIVLDLHMPMTSGFEVLSRLAQLGTGVPVLVVTGHDTPESRVRSLAGGAA